MLISTTKHRHSPHEFDSPFFAPFEYRNLKVFLIQLHQFPMLISTPLSRDLKMD